MTDIRARHSLHAQQEPGERQPRSRRQSISRKALSPGFANTALCYLCLLSFALSPVALLFSLAYAHTDHGIHRQHYYYIRTTIAVLVIGLSAGALLVLIGANTSPAVILSGVGIVAAAALTSIARCLHGLVRSFRKAPLRNHRTYLI